MARECAGVCSRTKVAHHERNYKASKFCELCSKYFLRTIPDQLKCTCCTTRLRTRGKVSKFKITERLSA